MLRSFQEKRKIKRKKDMERLEKRLGGSSKGST